MSALFFTKENADPTKVTGWIRADSIINKGSESALNENKQLVKEDRKRAKNNKLLEEEIERLKIRNKELEIVNSRHASTIEGLERLIYKVYHDPTLLSTSERILSIVQEIEEMDAIRRQYEE